MARRPRAQHRRAALTLAAVLAGDAAFDAVARDWVHEDLTRLRVPPAAVRVIIPVKSAAAAGLLVGSRRRRVGQLTSAGLVAYFVLAVGAHARVKDELWRWLPAIGMLAWCARTLRSFQRT
jgi:hypothetical protein